MRRRAIMVSFLATLIAASPVRARQDEPPAAMPVESAPSKGQEVAIILRDGRRFEGILVDQTEFRVVLRIAGIDTTFDAEKVDRVRLLPSVEEQYLSLRAAIDDRDAPGLLRLAGWLLERKRYRLALAEVERVLEFDPRNQDARRLHTLIAAQEELAQRAMPEEPDAPAANPVAQKREFPLLTPEQVNLIKVYEIDLANPPRMVIDRATIGKLIDSFPGHALIPATREGREAFLSERPEKILDTMFQLQARDLYPLVRVLDHPRPFRLFRDHVYRTWLINHCASNRCHGGEGAGRLALFNRRENSDATMYTNFLILERFRLDDGTPLIDYAEPARSPLVQMTLPRDQALFEHPVVPNASGRGDQWKPLFQSTDDRRFAQAVEWIRSMYSPRPEYPIDYTPPRPSTAPARPEAAGPR